MGDAQIIIFPMQPLHKVGRNIYGSFAEHIGGCIYDGIWVGKDSHIPNEDGIRLDTLNALEKLEIPVIRWPGGCFADTYHWQDGVGDPAKRPLRQNIWRKSAETNAFGTHEFMQFCRLIGSQPYICANVGLGTPEEARSWVEYCNVTQNTTLTRQRAANGSKDPFGVRYWGVGNESWGCGGRMTPEHYSNLYKQYASYMRNTDENIFLIASGSHYGYLEWDRRFIEAMKGKEKIVDGIAIHNYTGEGIPDLDHQSSDYFSLMSSINYLDRHISAAADVCAQASNMAHQIKVVLDEWGAWYAPATMEDGLTQHSTMVDAIFTALSFHLFHRHADVLEMANMAQTANVLQSLIKTKDEAFCLTPNYWVFEMFKPHRDGLLVNNIARVPSMTEELGKYQPLVSVSATIKDRNVTVSVVNVDPEEEHRVVILLYDVQMLSVKKASTFHSASMLDHNTPENPNKVPAPKKLKFVMNGEILTTVLPPHSVNVFELEFLK